MSKSLRTVLLRMSPHEVGFLKTVCQHRREAVQFLRMIDDFRAEDFNPSTIHTDLGVSMSHLCHLKTRLHAIALDSIAFYQHLVTHSGRPPSPQARCMRALRHAQTLRERKLIGDSHSAAKKASKIARENNLRLHQVMAAEFLSTTKRSCVKTSAIQLYNTLSINTSTLSQYYALQAICFELIEHSPFTPASMMNTEHFDRIIAMALVNVNQFDSRTKAQLLLTQLWHFHNKPNAERLQQIIDELDKLLKTLKPITSKSDWLLLQVLKVGGETMHNRFENVEALAKSLSSQTALTSPLICQPLRRMAENLMLEKRTEHLLPVVDRVLSNAKHLLLGDEENYWRFLKGAVCFAEGEHTKCRHMLIRVSGFHGQTRLEVDLINIMSVFEQGHYLNAEVHRDAFRKRIERGAKRYHKRYKRIATLLKFLLRVAFKERTLADLDEELIDRNPAHEPSQVDYYEVDFDTWFWEKMKEFGEIDEEGTSN